MKQKWKHFMSLLVCLSMVFSLMPGMGLKAQAWDSDPYANYVGTNRTVKFNNMDWYIIQDESTAADAGTLTLFAKDQIGCESFNETDNVYSSSIIKKYLDNLTEEGRSFADVADAIVTIPSLTTNGFESTEIYDTATNVKLYLLSTEEADAITNQYVRKCSDAYNNAYWLRSPGNGDNKAVYVIGTTGYVDTDGAVPFYTFAVRPALKLNLSKVTFSSETATFSLKPAEYSVTLSGGANAVADPPTGTSQSGLTGAMTTVTYEAVSGYHFEEFTDITQNGITVTRTSDTIVTVSGMPTADTAIMVPDAVENGGNPATGTYADYVNTTKTVKFNDIDWYIIADDSTAADAGTITLLSKDPITAGGFNEDGSEGNIYSTSKVKGYLDGLTAEGGSFAGVADAIVTIPSLTTNGFESTEIYDTAENVKLYLLSYEEAGAITNVDVRKCSQATGGKYNSWWLRSPFDDTDTALCMNGESGDEEIESVNIMLGVRPALKLDLSKVIFSPASMNFSLKPAGYSVKLLGGANASAYPSDSKWQSGLTGAMTTVKYEADAGCYFEEFTDITQNGITVTRTSEKIITVFGTPTADTVITVPDAVESLKPAEYSVTLSGGANAVADPPTATSQSGLTGAMTTVTYEAFSGYHFEEFTDITQNGITVTRTGDTIVTVSGTPTADTAITVPDAVENNNGPVTGAYADYVNTTKTVKFNGIDWYIIADDSIAADAGTVTLFARDPISVSKFNTSEDSTYSSSIIKGYLDGLTAKGGSFANVADVIFSTDLTDVGVQGAKLWLLSLEEAKTLSKDIRKCSMPSGTYQNMNYWYLRTPGDEVSRVAVINGDTGIIGDGGVPAYIDLCVRPALKLDLVAVVFSSESGTFNVAKPIEYAAENRDNPATGPNTQKDQTQTRQKTTVTAPAKVVLSSAKNNKSKTCTVKWKAVSDAKGYEVQYAFDKKFKKKVKTKTAAKTSLKLKKLKKGKTYYVRVRAYQINALGGKIYGDWSKAKKVKIKK
ncbi:MAG: hypothetical protein E7294_12235 [Lachnospiraceae bacterium]|nr:hypothetical protein [Lachnospiraceae bacterium]